MKLTTNRQASRPWWHSFSLWRSIQLRQLHPESDVICAGRVRLTSSWGLISFYFSESLYVSERWLVFLLIFVEKHTRSKIIACLAVGRLAIGRAGLARWSSCEFSFAWCSCLICSRVFSHWQVLSLDTQARHPASWQYYEDTSFRYFYILSS